MWFGEDPHEPLKPKTPELMPVSTVDKATESITNFPPHNPGGHAIPPQGHPPVEVGKPLMDRHVTKMVINPSNSRARVVLISDRQQ